MRYVDSRVQQEELESSYRFFVSEGIKILTKNTSGGTETEILKMNFNEFIQKKKAPPETRTANEIITGIKDKLTNLGGGQS